MLADTTPPDHVYLAPPMGQLHIALDAPPGIINTRDLIAANIAGDIFNAALFIVGGLVVAWLSARKKPATVTSHFDRLNQLGRDLHFARENYESFRAAQSELCVGGGSDEYRASIAVRDTLRARIRIAYEALVEFGKARAAADELARQLAGEPPKPPTTPK